jgi:omega-amidase
MLIALASLNQIWEDKDANLANCEDLVHKAKSHKADLIVFPEMTLTGFSMNTSVTAEGFHNSQTIESFKELAIKNEIAIIFGMVFSQFSKASNNGIFIGKSGKILGIYQKIHPFSFSGEDKFFTAGSEILKLDFDSFRIGLTICYDLRFPELYSALSTSCDLIINIANWPSKRLDHWNTLLKARAIENQIFVAGINRVGKDLPGNEYTKSSIVIDPNGVTVSPIYSEAELDIIDIDRDYIEDFKRTFSTTQDRNPEFYKGIL